MSDEHLLEMGGLLQQLIQQFASQGITPDEIEQAATEIHEEQRQETAQTPNHSTLASHLIWCSKTMEEKKRETDEMIVRLHACDFVIAWWQNHGGHLTGEEEVFEWRITN
jgi:hypothetical protein